MEALAAAVQRVQRIVRAALAYPAEPREHTRMAQSGLYLSLAGAILTGIALLAGSLSRQWRVMANRSSGET